jgi:hypothetical protein
LSRLPRPEVEARFAALFKGEVYVESGRSLVFGVFLVVAPEDPIEGDLGGKHCEE